eukprot:jgi/Ulvmu1/4254/UM193_0002.1
MKAQLYRRCDWPMYLQTRGRTVRRFPLPLRASGNGLTSTFGSEAKARILKKLEADVAYPAYDLNGQLVDDIEELCQSAGSTGPGRIMSLGQGEWEVFQVPHIVNSTKPLGARFAPILYRLEGQNIFSHVKYNLGPLGEGWLSASGTASTTKDAMSIMFDKFWVDVGADALRRKLADPEAGQSEAGAAIMNSKDKLVTSIGCLAFIPQFANFPVYYVDEDITVFCFTVLSSTIAARKVA